jgi:hypothetical protein
MPHTAAVEDRPHEGRQAVAVDGIDVRASRHERMAQVEDARHGRIDKRRAAVSVLASDVQAELDEALAHTDLSSARGSVQRGAAARVRGVDVSAVGEEDGARRSSPAKARDARRGTLEVWAASASRGAQLYVASRSAPRRASSRKKQPDAYTT